MKRTHTQTESIRSSPEQICDWLDNWDHVKAWMGPSLISIEMLSEHPSEAPLCRGMKFKETRKMGKMNAKATITVEQHQIVDGVFYHDAIFDDGCNRMRSFYSYEPTDSGTNATWTMSSVPNKWWTKAIDLLTGPMMIKMVAKCEKDHLQRLKALIESE